MQCYSFVVLGPEKSLHCTAKSFIPVDNWVLDCFEVVLVLMPTMTYKEEDFTFPDKAKMKWV